MDKLQALNDNVLEQIKFIDKDFILSNPLVVSPKAKGTTLYLGQETNTWYGSHKDVSSAREIEKHYDYFFLEDNMPNTLYWKFIREITNSHDVANDGNIIWNNLFICSNKECKGTPKLVDEIKNLSIEYLLNIVDIFGIESVISVIGPCNPYYDVLNKFASELGWQINGWPNKNKPIVYSDNKKILYTYHPMYLQKSKNFKFVVEETKKFINKSK